MYERDIDELDKAQELLEMCDDLEDAWSQICPETESERLECEMNPAITSAVDNDDAVENIPDLKQNHEKAYKVEKQTSTISRKEGLITEYFYGLITEYALPRRSLGSAVKNCSSRLARLTFLMLS